MTGNKKPKIVLIGAGGMGRRWAGVLAKNKGVSFYSIMDKNIESALTLARQYGVNAYDNLEPIISDKSVEIAVVAIPHKFLAQTSGLLLESGKHVICEKPGATSSAELFLVKKTAEKNHRRLMISCNHRFHPSHLKAKELVEKGKVGKLLFMIARYGFGGREGYEKEWRLNKNVSGGGELIDQGIHLIDLARWFLGDIKEAKGFLQNAFWKANAEDNAFVLLRDLKGRIASLHASWTLWRPTYLLELWGDKGYIIIEGLGKKYGGREVVRVGTRSADFKVKNEKVIECDTDADKSLEKVISEFLTSIKEKRLPNPSPEDAIQALKIVEKIYSV